jgi:ubiquinone biosynthesis monooxygenase Coq7
VTVKAVESFVEQHFQEQIVRLWTEQNCPELLELLEDCCEDEVHHKGDAAKQLLGEKSNLDSTSWWVLPYSRCVQLGSSIAAELA